MRQDAARTERNKAKKTALKTAVKKARTTNEADSLSQAFSKLDKAAKTHLIHKKKAARLKSRLAKAVAKLAPKVEKKTVAKAAPKAKTTRAKVKKEAPATE